MSGEQGGNQAKSLLVAGIIGGIYDFLVASFGTWTENFTSRVTEFGCMVADKTKLVFSINTSAALLGMGYIVGLKYASIICFGSVIVWWVIVPLIAIVFPELEVVAGVAASTATPEQIFLYAKSIGIGGIATAGIIGVVKSWGVIRNSFSLVGQIFSKKNASATATQTEESRIQRDLPMKIIAGGTVLAILVTTIFFFFGPMEGNLLFTIVGIIIVACIAFLFTAVAANAIAIVGSNPVSGMTLMTLILSSIIMVLVGLNGIHGMVAALIMGGVVCTALSSAGSFVTDLKIGYWLGSTPRHQEAYKFIGILVSAATVGGVIMILNKTYGFTPDNSDVMAAPQARAMAAVIEPLMTTGNAPWMLYFAGAVLALILNVLGVPVLAFALGMFIPLHLNLPLLIGGAVAYIVTKTKDDSEQAKAQAEVRNNKGTLIASGFIAGGALMGVVSAVMKFCGIDWFMTDWSQSNGAALVGIVAYIGLIAYFILASKKIKSL